MLATQDTFCFGQQSAFQQQTGGCNKLYRLKLAGSK